MFGLRPSRLRSLTGRSRARTVHWLIAVMFMLGGVFSPLMPLVDAATLTAQQHDAQLEQVAPLQPLDLGEGESDGGDDPMLIDPGLPEVAASSTTLTIGYWWCPSGLDPSITNPADAPNLPCDLAGPSARVYLYDANSGSELNRDRINSYPASSTFADLPTGAFVLEVDTPMGLPAALYCITVVGNDVVSGYMPTMYQPSNPTGWVIDAQSGGNISCDWFGQIPDTGTLYLTKWNCPEAQDPTTFTYDNGTQQCAGVVDPSAEFYVVSADENEPGNNGIPSYDETKTTRPHRGDTISFPGLPEGLIHVSEISASDSTPVAVFCSVTMFDSPAQGSLMVPAPQPVEIYNGNSWDIKSSAGMLVSCDVFNAPAALGAPVEDPSQQVDPEVDNNATEPVAPDPDPDPIIPDNENGGAIQPLDTNGEGTEGDIIATGGTGTIIIDKFTCPENIPGEVDFAWYGTYCAPFSGVTFSVGNPETGELYQETSDSSAFARSHFGNLSSGVYTITESVPDGYMPGAVVCARVSDSDFSGSAWNIPQEFYDKFDTTNGSIRVPLDANETWVCAWFNIPGEMVLDRIDVLGDLTIQSVGGDIFVEKHLCTAEALEAIPDDANHAWYEKNCYDMMEDVEFSAIPSGETSASASGTTDDFGQLTLAGLDVGDYTLQETPLPEYETLIVYCLTSNNQEAVKVLLEDDGAQIEVRDGEQVLCHWFNIEIPEPTVDLRIAKWVCDEVASSELTPDELTAFLTDHCSESPVPVTYTVTNDEGYEATVDDDNDNGIVILTGLLEGTYQINELVPDGYEPAAVYCNITSISGSEMTSTGQTNIPLAGNTISVDFPTSGEVYCQWMNTEKPVPTTITVHKYVCDETAPIAVETEFGWYKDNCTAPQEGVNFTVALADSDDPGTTQATDAAGTTSWDVNPFPYVLIEEAPEGYDTLAVFCSTTGAAEDATMMDAEGDIVRLDMTESNTAECFWFNQVEPDTTITVHKYVCDETAPIAVETEFGWYKDNCTAPQDGVNFTVALADSDDPGTTQATDATGTTSWDVNPFPYVLIEDAPDGYSTLAVFCSTTGAAEDAAMMDAEGNVVRLDMAESSTAECFWFNQAEPDTTITVHKYVCDEAAPIAVETEFGWYKDNCTAPQEGVDFTVALADSDDPGTTQATDAAGTTSWDVNPFPYVLIEEAPEGYDTLAVFCSTTGVAEDATMMDAEGDIVRLNMDESNTAECFWFNHEEPEPVNTITINKWECPATGDALPGFLQSDEWLSDNCDLAMPDVDFTLTNAAGTETAPTDATGSVVFSDVPSGNFTITESVPAGYNTPVVAICAGTVTIDGAVVDIHPARLGVSDAPLEGSLDPEGQTDFICDWFNFTSTIHVVKAECPADAVMPDDPETLADWLDDTCAVPMEDVTFTLNHGGGVVSQNTDAGGTTTFDHVDTGNFILAETVPPGYSPAPAVFCTGHLFDDEEVFGLLFPDVFGATIQATIHYPGSEITCYWFNLPEPPNTITINKWECPVGTPADMTVSWFESNCMLSMDGVDFTLTDGHGVDTQTTVAGQVQWTDVTSGAIQVAETVPTGYFPNPFVVCSIMEPADGGPISSIGHVPTVNGVWNTTITTAGTEITCDFYNWYLGPGEITVHKWTCPEGYNRAAAGANPMLECTVATDGVTFKLDQPGADPDLMSDTGDSIPGAVYFGGLEPGDYTLTETAPPPETMDMFVWQCTGLSSSSVHPTPLSVGADLNFTVTAGDSIECHWFNVPAPQHGWMVITKYNCTTDTFVNYVYCYTNRVGEKMVLQYWNGTNWQTLWVGITNSNGNLTFTGLDAGDYRIIEPNAVACRMEASNITSGGNIGVAKGEGTIVHVYNCGKEPPPPDKPEKYPDTGVSPDAANGPRHITPGIELAGLIGLLGMHITRRRMIGGAGVLGAGVVGSAVLAQDEDAAETIPLTPLGATPVPATPIPGEGWGCGTPVADGDGIDYCNRGPVPIRMRIPAIGVDAAMEYQEILRGEMTAPSNATDVVWYKETSRLGEVGNGLYAGHLNYWGIPEGVFFRLESLKQGDVIEMDGDNLQTYLYEVQWMQNFPSDEEPPEEALGLTDDPVITLVTCGGAWNSGKSQYDHRTLVRAIYRAP